MVKHNFKVGDVVKVVPPPGREFTPYDRSFRGGIVWNMVKMVEQNNKFVLASVSENTVTFENNVFCWDIEWIQPYYKVKNNPKNDVKVRNKKVIKTVDFIMDGKTTMAVYENKVGTATRNPIDENDEKVGMIISLLRVLNISPKKINQVIDILFDDVKPQEIDISKIPSEELIIELHKRI